MAEVANDWRARLCRYLGERIGERVAMGEMSELFLDLIPLHHATRIWLQRRGNTELSNPLRMRRHCLTKELTDYPLVWQPALSRGRLIADSDVLIPQGRSCPGCGSIYFARNGSRHCSPSCARKSYWRRRGDDGRYAVAAS